MPKEIKCVVEECTYNQGQMCHADSIEVRSSGDKKVETTDGTACNTFAPMGME